MTAYILDEDKKFKLLYESGDKNSKFLLSFIIDSIIIGGYADLFISFLGFMIGIII